jgi:hypothetical protein
MLNPDGMILRGLAPEQKLVAAFLALVVDDARRGPPHHQGEARAFLRDAGAVRFWCALAEIDEDVVFQRVRPYLHS